MTTKVRNLILWLLILIVALGVLIVQVRRIMMLRRYMELSDKPVIPADPEESYRNYLKEIGDD